ncbi:SIS domain-containing protein [Kitasatospora sp. NPDC048365]|uniref:SIS domain-containing protein n=1 Tax=Kitasatospora sp. NPDC048365 TaxID=3364050 RepID=UPI0037130226
MLDDSLLDDPAALQRADRQHALLALAGAGARVRIALRLAEAAGLSSLRPDGRPRAVLVAGHGSALTAAAVLAALAAPSSLVLPLPPAGTRPSAPYFTDGQSWVLPGWAGPLDLIVLASSAGREGGLINLAEQAYARGCAIAVIAPERSDLLEAAQQVRGLPLPFATSQVEEGEDSPEPDLPVEDPAALWAYLTPLLALADRVGAAQLAPGALEAAADRLDEVAVRCRPDAEAYGNPAKGLAGQLAETVPLLWADGPTTAAAAERFAAMLADQAGLPAPTGRLPQALTAHRGMFTGRLGAVGGDLDDFFRDRVDEPGPLQLQVVLLRHTPGVDELSEPGYAVARARRLADAHEVRFTDYTSSVEDPLQALAELIGLTDFAAVYLGLATKG